MGSEKLAREEIDAMVARRRARRAARISEAVREALAEHGDEVKARVSIATGGEGETGEALKWAFGCLIALCEGRDWPDPSYEGRR